MEDTKLTRKAYVLPRVAVKPHEENSWEQWAPIMPAARDRARPRRRPVWTALRARVSAAAGSARRRSSFPGPHAGPGWTGGGPIPSYGPAPGRRCGRRRGGPPGLRGRPPDTE